MTKSNLKIKDVHFSIEGEFITNHFRGIVQEGNWRKANDGLKDSITDFSTDDAYAVLSGKKKFTGTDSVFLKSDNKDRNEKWLNAQYFPYFNNVILHEGKFYTPCGVVSNLSAEHIQYAFESEKYESFADDIDVNENSDVEYFNRMRAMSHISDKSCKFEVVFNEKKNNWSLLKLVAVDYPAWIHNDNLNKILGLFDVKNENILDQDEIEMFETIDIELKHERTVDKAIRRAKKEELENPRSFFKPNVEEYIRQQNIADNVDFDKLKEEITEKANKLGGWLEVTNPETKVKYKIPKNAFYRWCMSDSSAYSIVEWGAVSPKGIKMGGDDPNHTDWWLFTGLSFALAHETSHEEVSFFYTLKDKTYKKLTKANITPLSRGSHKGFKKAKIHHIRTPDDGKYIPTDGVIIIPNASPDYELIAIQAAKNNTIIISETGGKLCHLATVGREFDICLYMMPNAFNKLTMTSFVKFDTESDIIETLEMDMEQNLKLKMSGFLYK
jgi:hypothetical protein